MKINIKNIHIRVIAIVILLAVFHGKSYADRSLEVIMGSLPPPVGVVFEVVDWKQDYLQDAIPWINQKIVSLRSKFPGLDIAVVSHGAEQFALLEESQTVYPQIHTDVQRLISDHDIKLELCLGHAGMRGFDPEDFPAYVEIEASGPSQIAAYQALGYDRIVVTVE